MNTYDDIFEEAVQDVLQNEVEVDNDDIRKYRTYRNCIRLMIFPCNYMFVWQLINRVLALWPNIIYYIGTSLKETDPAIANKNKTCDPKYKYILNSVTTDDKILYNPDNETKRVNLYLVFDFEPFTFASYCHFFEFLNYVIEYYDVKADLNFMNENFQNYFVTIDSHSADTFSYLTYQTLANMKIREIECTKEEWNKMKQKHIQAMFTEEKKDCLEIELIKCITAVNHGNANGISFNWKIFKTINDQNELNKSSLVRLNTTADNCLLCRLPHRSNIDGDVDMMIHEKDIVEFCKTGLFEPEQTNHTGITVKNSHCKRCRFFVKDRNFICMIFLRDSADESVDSSLSWDYYGFQISLDPQFKAGKRIELVLLQMFGEQHYHKIHDSLMNELRQYFVK